MNFTKDTILIINTTTLEDYIKVVSWALDQDLVWETRSRSINEEYWHDFESETCIIIDVNISFCDIYYSRYFLGSLVGRNATILGDMKHFYEYSRKYYNNMFGEKFGLR